MFLTTHAAVGLIISQHFDDPLAVFGLAFASHFVLDFIPHGDEELYHDEEWKVHKRFHRPALVTAIDLLALIGVMLWTIEHPVPATSRMMLVGILGSIMPDFLSYLFPIIHERLSWLFLARWLYKLTKPTGLRYLVRAQNWMHQLLHHEIIRRDVPFLVGLSLQVIMVVTAMSFLR